MSDRQRSINFMVSTAFPNAYFLDQGLWRVSSDYSYLNSLLEVGDIQDKGRVRGRVFEAICESWIQHNAALNRQDPPRVITDAEFVLLDYRRAIVLPGYDTFVCPSCERVYTRDQIENNNFRCLEEENVEVMQLQHLFVHGPCGTVTEITPTRCWNRFDGQRCNEDLRLHLVYQQMGASYWWCTRCRFRRGLPRDRTDEQQGWKFDLRSICWTCRNDGLQDDRMRLTTARSVFKAQRVDLVDMPQSDYQVLLQEWFGEQLRDEDILAQLAEPLRRRWESDPQQRAQLRRMFQSDRIGESGVPTLDPKAQEEIANYSGARSAIVRDDTQLPPDVARFLNEGFGLRVSLLDNLAIVRATYGYLVGGSTPEEAILEVFTMGGGRYGVLTQRMPTEALLFELDPHRVLAWLHATELAVRIKNETDLRRYLVSCEPNDEILQMVTTLVHTASHALRRSSERYTGMGRDIVDELLFPRGMAWVLYNNRGSELGMFTTTFEGRMREWLQGTRYDLLNCPLDPICMREDVAACPGCLHIGERGCTTLWNRFLDRRYLVRLPSSTFPGYWSRAL